MGRRSAQRVGELRPGHSHPEGEHWGKDVDRSKHAGGDDRPRCPRALFVQYHA